MAMNGNKIYEKAIEITKTGSGAGAKFVYEACGKNMFLADDICKKVALEFSTR